MTTRYWRALVGTFLEILLMGVGLILQITQPMWSFLWCWGIGMQMVIWIMMFVVNYEYVGKYYQESKQ